MKIRKFIDKTNSRTKMVNRSLNFSSSIYTVENINTFAEIKITVAENIIPTVSAISVNIIGVEVTYIVHSKIHVDL